MYRRLEPPRNPKPGQTIDEKTKIAEYIAMAAFQWVTIVTIKAWIANGTGTHTDATAQKGVSGAPDWIPVTINKERRGNHRKE
jgi:hypothetical protein